MNDVQMMWGWGWWVIESVFLRSPDKGFWACLGDIPPDMPRRPETEFSLCNLMLKLYGILRSSAILGSDSPQSNNRKDNSLWVTPFNPRERPNVKHEMLQKCYRAKSIQQWHTHENIVNKLFNPLSPHDALKHHFTTLKRQWIFLQPRVLERNFHETGLPIHGNFL